jgi:hypothetical protein
MEQVESCYSAAGAEVGKWASPRKSNQSPVNAEDSAGAEVVKHSSSPRKSTRKKGSNTNDGLAGLESDLVEPSSGPPKSPRNKSANTIDDLAVVQLVKHSISPRRKSTRKKAATQHVATVESVHKST